MGNTTKDRPLSMIKALSMKSIKTQKPKIKYYLIGSFIISLFLLLGIFFTPTNNLILKTEFYINHKQEISDLLGELVEVKFTNKPLYIDPAKTHHFIIDIKGKEATGQLKLTAIPKNQSWSFENITLNSNKLQHKLSPVFVSGIDFYAASLSSAALKTPVFLNGEIIHLKSTLNGALNLKTKHISQDFALFNANNELLLKKQNAAVFNKKNQSKEEAIFNNKISDLKEGQYYLQLSFKDDKQNTLETYWHQLVVQPSKQNLLVRSVEYYYDKELNNLIKPEFSANQNIYLRLSLDGFKINKSKIAGYVDLKVANANGDIIAFKPKFAAFNQIYDEQKNIIIDGHLQLKEPDIYFLSFRIRDFFSDKHITHEEKILVQIN
ncbi:hypothetical protein BVY03_04955 [bacterium K02(2017)]|nr:hypothetical protein BVY03_04955 [bacterium K02(2017)]